MPGLSDPRRWPVVVAVVAVFALAGGAGWLIFVWSTAEKGAAEADPQASVLGVVLASVVAASGVLAWAVRRRGRASLPATADQVDQATATLAGLVREQWQEEANARALGDPEPMPVRWRLTAPGLMDHPAVVTRGGEEVSFAGRSDRIGELADRFRALPRRRLVITGPAGSGKTTLALQLLLALLPPAGQPPDGPVPVMLSLDDWAPDRQPRVRDWLIERLERTYPALRAIAPDAAAALVTQGRVLPVLDGLDEVVPVRRAEIITALNASLDGDGGVILTSRRAEYRDAVADAGDVLTGSAAIAPLGLTGKEAAAFLRNHLPPGHGGREWDAVLDALETGGPGPLASVTASPLGLWLVRTVYVDSGRPPGPLTDGSVPDSAALRAHLLDELIPAVVRGRPPLPRRRPTSPDAPLRPRRGHRPEDLRRWLTTIAEQLAATERGPRGSEWRWWELYEHTFPTRRSFLIFDVLGLLAYLLVVALVGVVAASGSLAALTVGVLLIGPWIWLRPTLSPARADPRLAGRVGEVVKQLVNGVLLGSVLGLGVVWFGGTGPVEGLVTGLVLGSLAGLSNGLADVLGGRHLAEHSASPTRSFRRDLRHGVTSGAMLGLAVGLTVALAPVSSPGLSVEPRGLLVGLLAGLTIGAAKIASGASFAFLFAALWHTVHRRLPVPWRLMAVLEDCHRLGLLRTVGPVYQFRHAELQDHLAPPLAMRERTPA